MSTRPTRESIAIGAALALVFVLLFGVAFIVDLFRVPMGDQAASVRGGERTSPSIFMIDDIALGTGEEAVRGKRVTVHYTGTFQDGRKFDSSLDRGVPFTFTLGAGEVISGWDEGVKGMKVGGKRKLTVPPDLGYGPNDYGPIPGNSTLIFEIELLKVE